MQKKHSLTLFLLIFLVSCTSPTPVSTATTTSTIQLSLPSTATATQYPSPTETFAPTPTATVPTIPLELLAQAGVNNDIKLSHKAIGDYLFTTTPDGQFIAVLDVKGNWKSYNQWLNDVIALDFEYISDHSLIGLPDQVEVNDIPVSMSFGADDSIRSLLSEMKLKPSYWRSENGNSSLDALPLFIQQLYFLVWKRYQQKTESNMMEVDIITWLEMIKQARESGLASEWDLIKFPLWVDDITNNSHDLEPTMVVPFYNGAGALPDGVVGIPTTRIVIANGNNKLVAENIIPLDEWGTGIGSKLLPDGSHLIIYSPTMTNPPNFSGINVAGNMASGVVGVLSIGKVERGNRLILDSYVVGSQSNVFFAITGNPTPVELYRNRP